MKKLFFIFNKFFIIFDCKEFIKKLNTKTTVSTRRVPHTERACGHRFQSALTLCEPRFAYAVDQGV